MTFKANLLIISEDPSQFGLFKSDEIKSYCNPYFCGKQENVFKVLKANNIRIVVMDSGGDESWDFKLLNLIKTYDPIIDIVLLGPPVPSEKVLDWINQGATDYLIKPLKADTLQLIFTRLDEKRNLKKETYLLEKELEKKYVFQGMIGKSPFMLDIFSTIENIANYFSTALITGETGTGKEMIAKAIHKLSPVNNKRFVVGDCTSLPENLFESELFGYVKGAFTGADRNKKGLFEEADEGIIFLDEIGEIPISIQAKLLRVLETHKFRPLGSSTSKKVEVRVIAATNRDLKEGVEAGTFREDLYHRLNKVEIRLPSLKERPEDIPLLVRYFLKKYSKKFDKQIKGVSQNVQKLLLSYDWSGNVRELENVIERAAIFCKREFIDIIDLPKDLQENLVSATKTQIFKKENLYTLDNLEKEYITYILKTNNSNIKKTAEILDISRSTLYDKLKKYKIK